MIAYQIDSLGNLAMAGYIRLTASTFVIQKWLRKSEQRYQWKLWV